MKHKLVKLCIFIFLFILILSSSTTAQKQLPKQAETVDFCNLIKNASSFEGKTVRFKAIYRFGLEWQEFYRLNCEYKQRIAIEFSSAFNSQTNPEIKEKIKWSERGKTVNVIVVGKFSKINSGDPNGLLFKIIVDFFENAEIILNSSPAILPKKLRKKAHC